MKKVLKKYDCYSLRDFESLILSEYNANNRQLAKDMFMDMPRKNRIEFLKYCIFEYCKYPANGSIMFFNAIFGL